MAESATGPREGWVSLSAWTLATFDTVLFVLAALVPIQAVGALAGLLSGLTTLLGAAVFCYLWALFTLAVCWVLSDAALDDSASSLALRGVAAGGVAGVAFLVGIVGIAVVPDVVAGTVQPLTVLLFGLIASAVAAVVGGTVGLLFGAVDVTVYRVAGLIVTDGDDESAAATSGRR